MYGEQEEYTNGDSTTSIWLDNCIGFGTQDECLRPTNENGAYRCQWIPAPDDYDCSQLWPTDEPEEGCCTGNTPYSVGMCTEYETQIKCTSMASCHWLMGEDADCSWTGSTTGTPVQTGCCTLSQTQNENSGWSMRCPEFWTQNECSIPMDGFGQSRCEWLPTDQYFDCC